MNTILNLHIFCVSVLTWVTIESVLKMFALHDMISINEKLTT